MITRDMHRASLIAIFVAAILLGGVWVPRACGQTMSIGIQRPDAGFVPAVSVREVNIIARVLALGDVEREALLMLHSGHVATVQKRRLQVQDQVQEVMEEAQVTSNASVATLSQDKREGWEREAKELGAQFMADLKSLLTKEQEGRWPLVERELRRFASMPKGRTGGERVDMVNVIEQEFPHAWARQDVTDALIAYAASLDGLLKARDQYLTDEKSAEFQKLCVEDKPAAEVLWREAVALRTAVRDLNLRTAEEIAGLLGGQDAERLRRYVLCQAYPKLCTPSRSEAFIRAAGKLGSLTEEQRAAITEIVQLYDEKSNALIKETAAVRRTRDPQIKPSELDPLSGTKVATTSEGEQITFYGSDDMKPRADDPLTPLTQRRFELDRDTRRSIERLLTPEQRDECRQPAIEYIMLGEHQPWGI
jgi:hypothetical protein